MTQATAVRVEPPLVTALMERHGARRLDEETLEAFVAEPGEGVLFFTEDPLRYREVNDVAVILPELRSAAGAFRIGVMPPLIANANAARWGVRRWPALVFVREGTWLGNIEGVRDWGEYVSLARGLLAAAAQPLPARIIPLAAAGDCQGAHP
jgi:hydrogenase-1 operon protein HyaE